jgi:DNA-binding MarR family transcriptional regulator
MSNAPAHETVELLIKATSACDFYGDRQGLRDREWMALRFLRRANSFSRTPSALATYLSVTRVSASQIVKILESKSYVVRRPSRKDKRSVSLCVTTLGERLLNEHDPLNSLTTAIARLAPEDCIRFRESLKSILSQIDMRHHHAYAGSCEDCMFFDEREVSICSGRTRTSTQLECRFHRTPIDPAEVKLLCTRFESAVNRRKIDETREPHIPQSEDMA